MLSRERIRLALLKALAFVSFPPDLMKLDQKAKILLIRPDHLGDVLLTTPALRRLREALPEAEISYMVGPWAKDTVANNLNVDRVLSCNFPGFSRKPKSSLIGPYLYLRQQARSLRNYHFDVAVNLRFDFWWGAMLGFYANIPHRIGYATPETKPFLTLALPYLKGRHEVDQNLRLVDTTAKLAGPISPARFGGESRNELEFHPQAEDERFAQRLFDEQLGGGPVALIHPGTGAPVKLWRPEGFAEAGDALVEHYGLRVLLTGSAPEESLVREIRQAMRHEPAILLGSSLGELAAVLKRCRLAVGVDSGVMHLAAAMGTPTVRLYGPVSDAAFGPWGDPGRHVVVKSGMDCIPCDRLDFAPKELPDHPCVRQIEVRQVLAAVLQVMESGE